ncbi:NAD-dependent glycerol-3-phosphate dehydrogenase C-terminus [Ceratobasidium sp. AG-Ba]|nr:NAD-dependent glycerol-3-phosphate dehydrogenase C-terminus [Ceratobasidium sp. AG-Ba]
MTELTAINTKKHSNVFDEEVTMYVHEEEVDGKPLSALINEKHENVKYLPGVQLGSNIHAEPDLAKALEGATALVVVVPHQFFDVTLKQMRGHVSKHARAVSLIKGLKAEGNKIKTFPAVLSEALNIRCSALGGANIAKEVGQDMFCESTLGVPPNSSSGDGLSDSELWFKLFETPTFRIRTVEDVEGVVLCGGLKNIVALASGFSDGLGWGSNTKAAIIRIGLMEIKDFCLEFFPSTHPDTFLQESCGVADVVTSSISGRNRMIAEEMAKTGKSFQALEKEKLNGQQLEGPQTTEQLHNFIHAHGKEEHKQGKYRLLENVWKICFQGMSSDKLLEGL